MIKRLLIANRGEIACRVIKTAQRLGIHTIAIYSEIDASALHVQMADESHCIGPAASADSYLNIEKIIDVALESKADAIHPGYGFLSENTDFARRCHKNKMSFVGPPPEAIEVMANKNQAKELIEKANIPVTPGYTGEKQDLESISKAAKDIGFPVLLKAAAGGGGKGMRLVESENELEDAIKSAKRESKASFGDDTLFIEKYLNQARHVELQVFADSKGNKVHLFDRDCSVQRRHQKIIEEAPAPNLSDKTRKKMAEAALKILDTIDYLGAGTIEFMVDENENFYFMEMNTRLQVEHPVTEMITGLDLVEWQLLVASGEALPLKQDQIKQNGHAFEARICAEDPANDFSPSIGPLAYFSLPEGEENTRIDTGVTEGDEISMFYDSMIAKLIVWAENRDDALLQLQQALDDTHIVGVATNTEFLFDIAREPDFKTKNLNTQFIEQHPNLLASLEKNLPDELLTLAALTELKRLKTVGFGLAQASEDVNSPWFNRDGWRLHRPSQTKIKFWHHDRFIAIMIFSDDAQFVVQLPDKVLEAEVIWEDEYRMSISIENKSINATTVPYKNELHLFYRGKHYCLHTQDPKAQQVNQSETETHLNSPMPGTVVEVTVKPEQTVKKGETLIVLEAMKMEHKIAAPADGIIKLLHCKVGDSITEGVDLIEFEKLS